jgi:LPS O-antigen subunit length determinant protein (WzzB/FepE family)
MSELHEQTYIEDEGISLIDLFLIVWRKKLLIIALSFLGFLLGGAVAFVMNSNNETLSTIVEYQWDGINQGEYPNGARFEASNAFTVTVYLNAIAEAGVELTSNEVREQLTIRPIVPNNVLNAIQQAIENGEELTYFPTAFKYSLNAGQLGISESQARTLLNALIDGFRDDFEAKYIQQTVVLNYAFTNLGTYDYNEIARIYTTQLELIESAIEQVLPEGNSFISTELGLSFNDILVELDLIKTVDLNNMNALINTFLLTKNIDRAITRLEYNNEIKALELAKEAQVLSDIEAAIASYPGTEQTIVIPGLDGTIETTTYLEVLYTQLLESQRAIAELEQDIAFNESRIVLYEAQRDNDGNSPAAQEALAELTDANTGLLDSTNDVINTLVLNTNTLLEEYNLIVVRNIATNLTSPTVEEGSNTLLFAAIGLVLGGMVSLGVVFVDHTMKEYKKKKQA